MQTRIDGVAANPLIVWSSRTSACKRKSALIGGGSDGDPPTVKSEKRLGNSEKKTRSSMREGKRERGQTQEFRRDLALLPSPIYIVERGVAPSLIAQTIEELSTHCRLSESPWDCQITRVDNALGGIMPLGGSAACCCQG